MSLHEKYLINQAHIAEERVKQLKSELNELRAEIYRLRTPLTDRQIRIMRENGVFLQSTIEVVRSIEQAIQEGAA